MKYEIAYLSSSGNTALLARTIAAMFPAEEAQLTDMAREEIFPAADVYFIGFGVNRAAVPLKVMEALEYTGGKRALLFVTCGMEPTDDYKAQIEQKVLPFVPDDCDYRGLYLCAGQFPEEVERSLRETFQQNPDNAQTKRLLENCRKACGHPNGADLDALRFFVREALSN